MTNTSTAKLSGFSPIVLSLFRIVFGLLFTIHGTAKLFAWPIPASGNGPIPAGFWPFWYAGVLEVILGVLITVGLFTRIAAFIASGQMAVAYFWQHLPTSIHPLANGGEPTVLFCFAFLLLVFTGGGAIAVDAILERRSKAAVSV